MSYNELDPFLSTWFAEESVCVTSAWFAEENENGEIWRLSNYNSGTLGDINLICK